VLFVARRDDPAAHRGELLDVERSPFAPPASLLDAYRSGQSGNGIAFTRSYLEYLHQLWKKEPALFHFLVSQSEAGNITLVDSWHEQPHAPRKVLAVVLKRLDIWEAAQQRWQERRRKRATASSAAGTPDPAAEPDGGASALRLR
jgi:hypothetical protein